MRKPLKIILSIPATLLVLGVVTLVIVPFAVNVNDFKAQIEAAVQENTGRVLTIDGNLELSVFPWLGITTGKMTLNNAAGFTTQAFAQISQSQIKVKLWPLLFKQVEVSEIVLKGLNLNLLKKPQGSSNWDDLAALIADKPDQAKSPLKLLAIAGISITDAQISWDDQQAGKNIQIKDFNLHTDKLVFNQAIEVAFDFSATDTELAITERIDFSGDLKLTEALDVFSLKKFKLQSQTEAKFIPTGKLLATVAGDASFNLAQQWVKFSPVKIQTAGLTISATHLTAGLQPPFKLEGLIHIPDFDAAQFIRQQLAIQLPKMVDEKALTWLAADFLLNADANHASLQNLEIELDETTLKGSAQLNNFSSPAINFNLALDTVNFDRYLPPPAEEIIQNLNAVPATVAENASLFPLETLRNLNINGQLLIADLKVNNLTMRGVKLLFNAKNGFLQSQQSVDRLYQGAYNSKVVVDLRNAVPILHLHQQLSHIQIEPLLTDMNGQSRFTGLIDLNAKLEARGNTDFALKSSLNGRLSFGGKDMQIRGFNLQKFIDNGKILLSSATPSETDNRKVHTDFSRITATAIINNGFLSNNDLSANTAKAKVAGMGLINLVSQQLDYKIIALLPKENFATPVAKATDNFPVFINIAGTFDTPAYQVDLAAMGIGL